MDEDGVAWELYSVPPGEFASTRTAQVKLARNAGDRELAKRIQALRKPTLSAWLVNQLRRQHAEAVDLLLDLGDEMRAGMSGLGGDELRELTKRRYQLVAALVEQARSIAVASGQRLSDAVAGEVRSTLEATLADPDSADEVRAGRLSGALSVSGFGFEASLGSRPKRREPEMEEESGADVTDLDARRERREREIADAQAELDAAETAAQEAREQLRAAEEKVGSAERKHDKAATEVARLEDDLRKAKARLETRAGRVEESRRAREEADATYEEAAQSAAEAKGRLRELTRSARSVHS